MLAKPVRDLPTDNALRGGCAYELKFDGYRALLFVREDGCRVQSRRGHDITAAFDDVAAAAAEALPSGTVLDGELVVWGSGALDFTELQRRLAAGRLSKTTMARLPASFVAFDVLQADHQDVRSRPYDERRQLLEELLEEVRPPIQLVPQTTDIDEAQEWMDRYADAAVGIEGLVIKGRASRYAGGKRGWLKFRIRDTSEAIVAGVTGTLEQPERLILALVDPDGELAFAGTTTELNARQRDQVASLLKEPTEGDPHPWPPAMGERGIGRWGSAERSPFRLVLPTLVVEVSVDNAVENGRWRHPTTFVRARPDLTPAET